MPDKLTVFFRTHSRQLFIWVIFFLATVRGAIGPIPYISILPKIANAWPESVLSASEDYLLNSPAGLIAFKTLQSSSPFAYLIMCLVVISVGFLLLFRYLAKELPSELAGSLVRIFMLTELGYVLLRWTGSYDAFTFLFWMLLLISVQKKLTIAVLASSALLGFNHFEQGVVAVSGIVFAYQFLGELKDRWKTFGVVMIGIIFGKLALLGFLNTSEFAGRNSWLTHENLKSGIIEIISNFGYFAWSLFSVTWIFIYLIFRHVNWRKLSSPVAFLLIAFIVSTLTRDHTRVFVLTTFPSLLVLIASKTRTGEIKESDIYRVELASWVIPPLILWGANWVFPFPFINHLIGKL